MLSAREELHAGFRVKGLSAVDVARVQAVGVVVGMWCCVGDELLWSHERDGSLVVTFGQLPELVGGLEAYNSASGSRLSS